MIEAANSNEHGYALIDALVGIAIGGLIMLLVTAGLRQISAIDRRLIEDARARRDLLGLTTTLRQWVEPGLPSRLPESDQQPLLMRPVPSAAAPAEWSSARLSIRPVQHGQRQLELNIETQGNLRETAPLINASQLQLEVVPLGRAFLASFIGLSIQVQPAGQIVDVTIAQPQWARPLCLARPFHPECLK